MIEPDSSAGPLEETGKLAPRRGLIAALEAAAEAAPDDGLTLGAFSGALGERAFGVILFAIAIPVCMPFLYGVPQIVALPMIAIALQMAAGRSEPWMPERFRDRVLTKNSLMRTARWARRWFGWVEALARPRLMFMTGRRSERIVGGLFVVFCASILVPLPLSNTIPGIAIVLMSIGLSMRDGLAVLIGGVLGAAWVTLLFTGFLIFGLIFAQMVKDAMVIALGYMVSHWIYMAALGALVILAALVFAVLARRRSNSGKAL